MCSLTHDPPVWVCPPRVNSNDSTDFLRTVVWLLREGALVPGDILVMDNAAIHDAAAIQEFLDPIFEFGGVRLVFLPAYRFFFPDRCSCVQILSYPPPPQSGT